MFYDAGLEAVFLFLESGIRNVSDDNDKATIEAYLQRARRAIEEDAIPTRAQLQAIAEQMDMTPAESEQADAQAHQLTNQANRALDNGESDRAEELLVDAVLLSPVRLQPIYLLAKLYADRYGDEGDDADRDRALRLAERAQQIDPEHGPTRSLIEKLGKVPQHGLTWKRAALIVLVIVAISGSLQLCHRYYMTPEVDDEQLDEVREHLEQHEDPRRSD